MIRIIQHSLLRLLRGLDAVGHALVRVTGVDFPVWLWRICQATEAVHDRIYPDTCPCCRRFSHPEGESDS